jgi:hypothetical protein
MQMSNAAGRRRGRMRWAFIMDDDGRIASHIMIKPPEL